MLLSTNKGFVLLEMIVALSMLLFITLTIFPFSSLIMIERKNIEVQSRGNELLSDELQAFLLDSQAAKNKTLEDVGTQYKIDWTYDQSLQKWKACISWNNLQNRTVERCGYALK